MLGRLVHNRVEFPFELSGSVGAPSIGVDWGKAAQTIVQREARKKLDEIIAEKLGVSIGDGPKAGDPKNVAPTPAAARI